jgi:hypothetical protein
MKDPRHYNNWIYALAFITVEGSTLNVTITLEIKF